MIRVKMTVEDIVRSKIVVSASSSLRMVPGPESKRSRLAPMHIKTEQELRCSDGTQVPEPRMVTVMPDLSDDTAYAFLNSDIIC